MSGRLIKYFAVSFIVAAGGLTIAIGEAPAAPAKNQKMICRTESSPGSRLGKSRVCRTAAEWAELRRQTQANVDRIQNGRVWDEHNCPKPGSCD